MINGHTLETAKKNVAQDIKIEKFFNSIGIKMVGIPGKNFQMLNTEVTQKTYTSIMGSNPSYFKGENNPVERVSWYDAIYFCNKLSEKLDLTPVYAVNGKTDVAAWDYTPHIGNLIGGDVTQNKNANGFRLPTEEEWEYAAKGGQDYRYSGSDNLDEVGWYEGNSGDQTHPVAQKKANGYGLYDMSGNVWEWRWDDDPVSSDRYFCGGCYDSWSRGCEVSADIRDYAYGQYYDLGFRFVRSASVEIKIEKFFNFSEIKSEIKMVNIPEQNFQMSNTEVTQKIYKSIMGSNPSYFKGDNNPVENVSWYDAIYFCNKLSEKLDLTPVYAVNGKTDVAAWDYTPHIGNLIGGDVTQNKNANGFRLPTEEEWEYAAKGGQDYRYSGSDNLDEVGWYEGNSGDQTHPVAQKKANGYGLYDMNGNVWEWCWNDYPGSSNRRINCGGCYYDDDYNSEVGDMSDYYANCQLKDLGFRIVCSQE